MSRAAPMASCVLLLALLLCACGQRTQTASPVSTPAASPAAAVASPVPPTSAPVVAAATAAPAATVLGADEFQNPVLRADFPDPSVLLVGDTYYAYATNGSGKNIQVATSPDLIKWKTIGDGMPAIGRWAQLGGSYIWAPEVIQIGEQFVLYYTGRDKEADLQCIGVAVSAKPEGKFKDLNDTPLICQTDQGGSIDPSPFRDTDGTLYLYWKNDGNCCNKPTYLYVQELTPDGLSLVGEPTRLVRNDAAWEGNLVEAPTMWRHDTGYYLFFSANSYGGLEYAVGYALCQTAIGPCEDSGDNPILASVTQHKPPVIGPGHQTIVLDADGDTWMVYHAWEVTSAGMRGSRRFMWMDRLEWKDGKPDVIGPTADPQPLP